MELMASLQTDSFIQALRRFVARRGMVREIRTDNGTNFVGTENEVREAFEEMDQEKIGDFLTEQGCDYITWKRNTPYASHMGGVWERQIRTVKSVITSLLNATMYASCFCTISFPFLGCLYNNTHLGRHSDWSSYAHDFKRSFSPEVPDIKLLSIKLQ